MAAAPSSTGATSGRQDAARPVLDLDALPRQVRVAVERILDQADVDVVRRGEAVGRLTFRRAVLQGVVVPAESAEDADPEPPTPDGGRGGRPDGVTVVATTMRMSTAARARLAESMGEDYLVLDLAEAPPTTDVVLAHAVSHQLMAQFAEMFPQARIVVTEILDEELGLHVRGPVGVLLAAGAHAYVSPRPLDEVARTVHAYLTAQSGPALEAPVRDLPAIE